MILGTIPVFCCIQTTERSSNAGGQRMHNRRILGGKGTANGHVKGLDQHENPKIGRSIRTTMSMESIVSMKRTVGGPARPVRRCLASHLLVALIAMSTIFRAWAVDQTPTCPSGYTWMNPRCYQILSTTANWDTHRTNCISAGGWLATIRSSTENANVYSLIGSYTWIGLNDIASEGTFVWTHGETDAYRNFFANEPNGSGNCALMDIDFAGKWDDYTCTSGFHGACEANPICPGGYAFVSSAGVCREVQPSAQPTSQPSRQPSMQPSRQPSIQPTRQPFG